MNVLHIIAASLLFLQLAGAPAPEQKPREEASIEGIVVRSETGDPLRRAQLTITQVRPPAELAVSPPSLASKFGVSEFPAIAPVTTEADGVFRFTKLPSGSYRLSVACNGYVSTEYGKQTAGGQGTIITLTAGQVLKDISFRLRPAATVSGHVRETDGTPMAGISVSLVKVGYDPSGSRMMERVSSSTTDDRGEYRLFWLSPGRYYLSAGAADWMSFMFERTGNFVPEKSYLPFYYPGTFDFSRASIIDVLAGAEMGAMDIVMSRPVTYKIKGTIVDAGGGKLPTEVEMVLIPRSESEVMTDYDSFGGRNSNVTYANGVFEIANVLPGSYLLHATATPDFNAPLPAGAVASASTASDLFRVAFGRAATAELPVEVSASDLTGLKMTLNAGVRVSLRVSIEGRELSSFPDFEKIRVGLRPRRGQWIGGTRQQGPLGSDGAGAIDYVGNGEYRVWIDEGISDLYIKEATIEDVDVLNGFWKLSGTPTGALRIALGDKPGRVEGTLTDASSKPVPGVQVVLIPEKLRYRDELYKTVDTDEKGRFGFRAIAPGDYRIFAWEALEPFAYFNPELLSKYEQQGQFVHVSEASQQTVDVKMIPAPKD